jgi:hypothetical protein
MANPELDYREAHERDKNRFRSTAIGLADDFFIVLPVAIATGLLKGGWRATTRAFSGSGRASKAAAEELRAAALSKTVHRTVDVRPPDPGAVQRLHDTKIGHNIKSLSKKNLRIPKAFGRL